MLTSATVSDFSRFYRSPSIVTHLKNCGFDTYWISNQGRAGRWETNVTTIAMEADHTVFVNSLPYQFGYDEKIIAQLGGTEKSRSRKRAFFVHLTGSHAEYQSRYPEALGLMSGVDVVSHYDNSIFYTDYVLSKIFDRFKNDELLFVYVSDHGEIVSNEKFGHGGDETYRDEYRIPLIVWSKHQKRLSTLMESTVGKVINTESFDNFLRYLLGMDRTARLSYSDTVIAVDPANTKNYSELNRFGERDMLQAAVQP
jgi:glucan phosphoethanolaminetransferase (alkaline phosphatase superfamily)